MMELFWTPEAAQDRDEIYDYIEADNPAAALALDELFSEKASLLVIHPGLGRTGRVAGTRELVAHRNYILVYDTAGDAVRVLRVLHTARQWPLRYTLDELLTEAEAAGQYPLPPEQREWADAPPVGRESFKQEALASWAAYKETGRHLAGQDVRTWLNTWGTNGEGVVPECHKYECHK